MAVEPICLYGKIEQFELFQRICRRIALLALSASFVNIAGVDGRRAKNSLVSLMFFLGVLLVQ